MAENRQIKGDEPEVIAAPASEPSYAIDDDPRIVSVFPGSNDVLCISLAEGSHENFMLHLRNRGFDVLEVRNLASAADLIASQNFGCVLVYADKTSESLREFLHEMRGSTDISTTPVVVLVDEVDSETCLQLLSAGANDVLRRDVNTGELFTRLYTQLRTTAAWMGVVESHLRERSAISHALSQISPAATPELTADVICFELSLVRNLAGVAVVALAPDGSAITLAHHGQPLSGITSGQGLSQSSAEYLADKAKQGPWIEQLRIGVPISSLTSALEPTDLSSAVAVAPLDVDGEVLGLLLLGTTPGMPANQSTLANTLTSAIDFARVAGGLLAPGLHERDHHEARRAGLDVVIEERQFTPVYQPIVDLSNDNTVGFESLTRFTDGTRPDIRFNEATRLGIGNELELAVLETAIEHARALPSGTWLSLNVTPGLVLTSSELKDVLAKADRPITLELTEHDRIDDYTTIRDAIKALGGDYKVSVDDAGAGFASLRHVLALEPDYVKLDYSWVTGVDQDPARRALVAGLEYFSSESGSQLIAEGIETSGEKETLIALDVEFGQGYFLGKPGPVENWI